MAETPTLQKTTRVIVTGDRDDWNALPGSAIQWKSVPVLRYERLPVKDTLLENLSLRPAEWIIFTSPRAVAFWTETLLAHGAEFPVETRVACLGEKTAEVAAADGFTVDFSPKEPGTDGFLEAFEGGERASGAGARILIPAAEGGRSKLKEHLKRRGYAVDWFPLYRTLTREDAADFLTEAELLEADAIVFTSPSSVDAFMSHFEVPDHARIIAIGGFTGRHLESRGVQRPHLLPEGDFRRISEVL